MVFQDLILQADISFLPRDTVTKSIGAVFVIARKLEPITLPVNTMPQIET